MPAFRDPTNLTTWLVRLLYTYAAVCGLWIISDFMQLQLLASAPYSVADAETNDLRQRIVAILNLLAFLITVVVFCVWVYRANQNARSLGAEGMTFSPGWAVGWYFVPIATLWKPYQAMKEIWLASKNPVGWNGERRSTLLPWWWLFWIATCLIGQASFRASMSARTIDQITQATVISIAASIVSVCAAILVATLVREIGAMQLANADLNRAFPANAVPA